MTQGIIIGIAIAIIAFALYKVIGRWICLLIIKKQQKEWNDLVQKCELNEPRKVNVKAILDEKFAPLMAERDRLLKEQEKAQKK